MSCWATIEIPAGSYNEYELDDHGRLFLDWVAVEPFPANYGSIENTLAEDGDQLDVLVITDEPIIAMTRVEIKPVGVMYMIDNHEEDYKLVAVAKTDDNYNKVASTDEFAPDFRDKIQAFFKNFKDATNTPVSFKGWGDAKDAEKLIVESQKRFKK